MNATSTKSDHAELVEALLLLVWGGEVGQPLDRLGGVVIRGESRTS